ncbi:uncharacterized protein DUF4843 [Chitinophaga skermanii]|uniref:Uncharacterized protein DUF4843 n=1 Tax=Chitinophaga skermanii TaxID=331697 RepID=A0A327R4G4_9BACT|nr:DUF4843 domain-containing protein [Chitinophaga skermanii]RAJ11105.1 uncharacterized protein DUF4843 [Chitinophaga skermanii]
MKKYCLLAALICLAFFSCKKSEILSYSVSKDNIYLKYKNTDSIVYSFAYNPTLERDTVWIPVIISGEKSKSPRSFTMSVVDKGTSAVRNLHFEPLKSEYIMPADSGTTMVPIILLNIDTALANKSVDLTVRVYGGKDFDSELPDDIRSKRIFFSNRLEQPLWWPAWPQLGRYSRTKHQLFLISSGTRDLVIPGSYPDAYMEIPRALYYIANVSYFLNYPFEWVAENTKTGYMLEKRNDNTGDYDFYNIASPTKRFHLKYFQSANKYVFMDEYGQQIIF